MSSVTSVTIACLSDACSICASSTWKSTITGTVITIQYLDETRATTETTARITVLRQDANGKWWLLTNDKLICFDPDKLKKNKIPPLVHITKAEIPGDTTDWVTVLDTALFYNTVNNVSIRGRRNFLKISFTSVSTRYPEEITYQYRVSGLNEKWSARSHDRSVILDDLPPGKFTFELNAYNSDGVSSTVPDTLNISVTPKFFQRLRYKIGYS